MAKEVVHAYFHNSLTFKLRSDLGTNSNGIESLATKTANKRNKKCCH